MAGSVPAHLIVSRDAQSWEIHPIVCPVADAARKDAVTVDGGYAPRCQMVDPRVGRRSCPFWYATIERDNSVNRIDGSTVFNRCVEAGKSQARLSVLCLGQRRNRPPGV